jgi:hypothetical protein
MSVLRMRIVAGAAALAALVLSVSTASACCGCGGCGYQQPIYYAPMTVYRPVTVYAPVQPTYAVNQGPVYQVPAATAPEPVPEYVEPSVGYGYGGYGGYRGYGGYGYGHRYGYGYRHGYGLGYRGGYVARRAAFGVGYRAGVRGYGVRYHR